MGIVYARAPTTSAILLDAGGAQAVEAISVHLRLPAQELLRGQPVAGARVAHRQQAPPDGRNVQTASPVAQQPAPMHEPAEAAFHDPTAREHDEARLSGVTLDHMVAHAVPVRPLLAARCGEGPIQGRLRQAGPRRLAWIR